MLRVHWTTRSGEERYLDVEDDDVASDGTVTDDGYWCGVYAVEDIDYWEERAAAQRRREQGEDLGDYLAKKLL